MVEVQHKPFMTINRKLTEVHEKFILDCSRANIGPTLTFKFLKEVLGGYQMVGCTVGDIRNASRDIKAYAQGYDVQMVLDEMRRKKELYDAFTYHFEVNSENQYCMIFCPFTSKDNHGRPVTFAAGLVSNEKTCAFAWLFKHFIECMGVAPKMMVTDQDLGMRSTIEEIIVGTRHRWCMWYIMHKLSFKAPKRLLTDEHFKKDFHACVWSELHEPEEFEEMWDAIIVEYGLENPRLNLAEFYLSFNNALESQRHSNAKLNYADSTLVPILATDQPFEKHASTLFTDSMFRRVQEEIVEGCNRCRIVGMSSEGVIDCYKVGDSHRNTFVVTHDKTDQSYVCECKLFGRWMKMAKAVHGYTANVFQNTDAQDEKLILSNELRAFSGGMRDLKTSIDTDSPPISAVEKRRMVEEFYGMVRPQVVEVHPPDVIQTKGSCSTNSKRIISKREKAIKEYNRPLRRCMNCLEMGHHDSRNCPENVNGKGKEKC
ncbi:protein FAR1-RELATED SEQUENCE 5-like [Salvia hispanica]|uniref:protein FAR1-RELATED SEQUENCE 5-like n=1 Tax=Salvia hispanica TaxID=49212 RepID=UPI002009393A|nr:protein FAR1-RELATED SEQUENCE 5-like [Salvia hispanica]